MVDKPGLPPYENNYASFTYPWAMASFTKLKIP